MQSRSDKAPADHYEDGRDTSERPLKRRRGNGLEGLSRELGLMRDGAGSSSATFVGSASGIHFIRSVYSAIGSPTAANTSPEANLVPGEDDQLAAAAKPIWHENEVVAPTQLSFDILVGLTESYFDLWHPAFPFLHAPRVLNTLEDLSRGSVDIQNWDLVTVKSIMSIALADRRQTGPANQPVPSNLLFHTFDDAIQNVNNAMMRPATVSALQAVISVQLFLISMLRLNVASRLGGLIARMAFQLGLHRCPSRFTSFTIQEQQLRKRIWWSAYILERYTCQALGLPLLIHDDDVDVCYLNQEDHNTGNTVTVHIDERMRLLDMLAKHARLRGLIVELRNKRVEERDRNPETALHISAQLARWWNEIEDTVDQSESSISAFHKTVLETLKHESAIMLNRPLLALPKNTASFASAVEVCISAAKALLSNLSSLQSPTSSSLIWPSFTWTAWMSAFIIMFAIAQDRVSSNAATKNVDKSLKILGSLAARESVWPRACAVAIEDLRKAWLQKASTAMSRDTPTPFTIAPSGHVTKDSANGLTPGRTLQKNASGLSPSQQTQSNQAQSLTHLNTHAPSTGDNPEFHQVLGNTSISIPRNEPVQNGDLDWMNSGFFRYDSQPVFDHTDPLQSFDIPFWLGADNTLAWMSNNT